MFRMKKALAVMAAMILVLGLLCTGALAAGGKQGDMPQGNGGQGGGQTGGQGDMPGDQNGQIGGGQMDIPQYGRYLDTDKVAAAIAAMTDTDAAANLTALLHTYQAAVPKKDDKAVQEALQALLIAMTQTQAQDQGGAQGMDMGGMSAQMLSYLDTDAVAAAITMTDSSTAATLNGLLQAYADALISNDQQALQRAFVDLMEALLEAEL